MKVFWGLGKILVLGFWLVVLANALFEAPSPFGVMIDMAGAVLLTHLLELILFNGSLRGRRHPWRDRAKSSCSAFFICNPSAVRLRGTLMRNLVLLAALFSLWPWRKPSSSHRTR